MAGKKFPFRLGGLFRQRASLAASPDPLDPFPNLTSKWYNDPHEQPEILASQRSIIDQNGPDKSHQRGELL